LDEIDPKFGAGDTVARTGGVRAIDQELVLVGAARAADTEKESTK
jgi:hypothetical protein